MENLINYAKQFNSYDEFVGVAEVNCMYNMENICKVMFPASTYQEAMKRLPSALRDAGYRNLRDFWFTVTT